MFSLKCFSFCYLSSYWDIYHYHSTCDCCVLRSNAHHYDGYAGSHLCGADNSWLAWCGSATTVDSEVHNKGFCWPHYYAAATTTSVPDAFSGIWQLCHGFSKGKYLWDLSLSLIAHVICWCLMMFALGFPCGCHVHQWGLKCTTLWSIPLAGICASLWWSIAHASSALSVCSSPCFELGEFHATHSSVPQPFHPYC